MKAADTAAGKRLVDDLDLHWYPEARGDGVRITGTDTSRRRRRRPRAGAALALGPDLRREQLDHRPGSYNYGAISLIPRTQGQDRRALPGHGAGLHRVQLRRRQPHLRRHRHGRRARHLRPRGRRPGHLWELNGDESFTYAAFRAFRNYDGAGGAFGDTSIPATSSDVARATVYASLDAPTRPRSRSRRSTSRPPPTTAASPSPAPPIFSGARVYTITQAGGANVVRQADLTPVTSTRSTTRCRPCRSASSSRSPTVSSLTATRRSTDPAAA